MNPSPFILICSLFLILSACRESKKYHDEMPVIPMVEEGNFREEALAYRLAMNKTFRDPETSPLPDRYRKDFEGLDFFEPDSIYRVKARIIRTPEAQPFLMPTTTARQAREVRYGIAYFTIKGRDYELELYRSLEPADSTEQDRLFLPFLDNTNGVSTYEGGRYLDLDIPAGDSLVIDFNKAYNPYCTYNKKYSCPIVPRVNYLDTEILAGVKAFKPAP